MTQWVQALSVLLPVLYLVVASLYGMELAGERAPKPRGLRRGFLALTFACHTAYIGLLTHHAGHLPLTDPWVILSFVALGLLGQHWLLERWTRTPSTGVFVAGVAFLLQLIGSAGAPRELPASESAVSPFFLSHVVPALLAVSALLLSGFYGGLYLLLLRQIRRRHYGVLFDRLPDLERLSRLLRGAATLGFLLLTVGLNLGIWWAHSGGVQQLNYLDPKVFPAIVLWIIFGVIGISGFVRFLSGRRAAWIAVSAAGLLVISLVVSFVPVGSLHVFD